MVILDAVVPVPKIIKALFENQVILSPMLLITIKSLTEPLLIEDEFNCKYLGVLEPLILNQKSL